MMRERETDVLIIGGGTGSVAAALAALRLGKRVIMTEETDWIGGQLTAQACGCGTTSSARPTDWRNTLRP